MAATGGCETTPAPPGLSRRARKSTGVRSARSGEEAGAMRTWSRGLPSVILLAILVAACGGSAAATIRPVPRVGLMHVGTDHNPPSLATLVAGLGDLGWFDGPPAPVMQQLVGDKTLLQDRMKQLQ